MARNMCEYENKISTLLRVNHKYVILLTPRQYISMGIDGNSNQLFKMNNIGLFMNIHFYCLKPADVAHMPMSATKHLVRLALRANYMYTIYGSVMWHN